MHGCRRGYEDDVAVSRNAEDIWGRFEDLQSQKNAVDRPGHSDETCQSVLFLNLGPALASRAAGDGSVNRGSRGWFDELC